MTGSEQPTILIVEDEPDVAETYARWLTDYDVRRVETGAAALDAVDDDVDIVLLDRMLPDIAGADVLAEIRARGIDCQVAMVTAVDPDFDVVEMGFDDYVTKPPTRDGLHRTVERLLERATLDEELQEYYSLVARRTALETEYTESDLDDNEEYVALLEEIDSHRAVVDDVAGDLSQDAEFIGAVREIMDDAPEGGESDGSR